MKTLSTLFAALLLTVSIAQANDTSVSRESCSAKAVEQFYCPTHSGWYQGPYYDAGCSVRCEQGQNASCSQASCDDGEAVASSCICE